MLPWLAAGGEEEEEGYDPAAAREAFRGFGFVRAFAADALLPALHKLNTCRRLRAHLAARPSLLFPPTLLFVYQWRMALSFAQELPV